MAKKVTGLQVQRKNGIWLWCFPESIQQCVIEGRTEPSYACCLIAISLADNIFKRKTPLPNLENSDEIKKNADYSPLYNTFIDAMKQGNRLADEANILLSFKNIWHHFMNYIFDQNKPILYNLPESLQICNSKFEEVAFFQRDKGNSSSLLCGTLKSAIYHPSMTRRKKLFFVVMFHGRSTLVIVETKQKIISIFDSHYHENYGAMIAFANLEKLKKFCDLVIDKFFPETKCGENLEFEITMLKIREKVLPWYKQIFNFRTNVFENVEKCMKEIE